MINSCVNWRMESAVLRWSRIIYTNTQPLGMYSHYKTTFTHINFILCVLFFFRLFSFVCSLMNTWLRRTLNAIRLRVVRENKTTHISNFARPPLRSHFTQTLHSYTRYARYWYDKYLTKWSMRARNNIRRPIITYIYIYIDIWPFYVDH